MRTTSITSAHNGNEHGYTPHPLAADWNDVAGVYIFARQNSNGSWEPIYVGKATSFRERLKPSHEKWHSAVSLGATHVLTCCIANSLARSAEERSLIKTFSPPLNVQHSEPR